MDESIRGEDLELEHLEEVMGKLWRHSGGKQGHLAVKTELVLNAFTGQCYACQEKGHRANKCPNREANKVESGSKNFNGTCNHCGRQGHKKQNCWELPENAEKRHSGYKSKTEHAHVSMQLPDTEHIEFVLCAIEEELIVKNKDSDGCV